MMIQNFLAPLKNLKNRLCGYFRSEQKSTCIFIPQNQSCAVDKTHSLLFNKEDSALPIYFILNQQDIMPLLDFFTLKKKSGNIVMFAHYSPTWPNVKMCEDEFCEIDWGGLFNKNALCFGHICHGATLFEKYNVENWISYADNISFVFGHPKIEERFIMFFNKAITIMDACLKIEDAHKQILALYSSEIVYLKSNRANNYEYELILPYVYENLKKIRMNSEVAPMN